VIENPEEFRIQLKDLPDAIVEEVRRISGDYTIPIASDYTPLGSGTLARIDEWPGILTARHVIQPDNHKLRLDQTGHPEHFLRTALGPFAHDLSITTNALRFVITPPKTVEYGPDLAFVALPPSPFLDAITARKSFLNLTKNPQERKQLALHDTGFFALCGFPAVKDFAAPPELGFSIVHGLYGYSMFTGPESYYGRDGWDYYEMPVSQEAADDFQRTFGGVSGGGVWRVDVVRSPDDQPGKEKLGSITLAGVAFYQVDDVEKKHFLVRAHGPVSIYERMIDGVRSQLS